MFLTGEWRIGQELKRDEDAGQEAKGTRGVAVGRDASGGILRLPPESGTPTLAEKVGNRQYGWRLKQIAPLALEG